MNLSSDAATPFQYPAMRGTCTPDVENFCASPDEDLSPDNVEQRLAAARIEGRAEGEKLARQCFEQEMREVRAALGSAVHEFVQQRSIHLRALEAEAVKLSLAIARRVLRRESQLDPSLLLALVRSSLTELAETSKVRLFVHPTFAEDWREFFRQQGDRETAPELVMDTKLHRHQCRIESPLGSTTLDLESRLAEIENGLFDLLSTSMDNESPHHVQ